MPKAGDHIQISADIVDGRGPGRNNKKSLGDPAGGQTSVSDYTCNGLKSTVGVGAGQTGLSTSNYYRIPGTAGYWGGKFWTECWIDGMGAHQYQIFDNPNNWEWQCHTNMHPGSWAPSIHNCRMVQQKGRFVQWQHNLSYWALARGEWFKVRARFKDPGGICNHIPGITDWKQSNWFLLNGKSIPYTNWQHGQEDGGWTGGTYGYNNGHVYVNIQWPHHTNAEMLNRYKSGAGVEEGLSYYSVSLWCSSHYRHYGSINVSPGNWARWSGIDTDGSKKFSFRITGHSSSGKVIIPSFGTVNHHPGYGPTPFVPGGGSGYPGHNYHGHHNAGKNSNHWYPAFDPNFA